jgi:hypothetical protein
MHYFYIPVADIIDEDLCEKIVEALDFTECFVVFRKVFTVIGEVEVVKLVGELSVFLPVVKKDLLLYSGEPRVEDVDEFCLEVAVLH